MQYPPCMHGSRSKSSSMFNLNKDFIIINIVRYLSPIQYMYYINLFILCLIVYLSVYLSVCLSVCLCPITSKRVNRFFGTSHDLWEGLGMLKITQICILKCTKNIIKLAFFFWLCFIMYKKVQKKMLTNRAKIKSWNRRWAQSTLSLVLFILCLLGCLYVCIQ